MPDKTNKEKARKWSKKSDLLTIQPTPRYAQCVVKKLTVFLVSFANVRLWIIQENTIQEYKRQHFTF